MIPGTRRYLPKQKPPLGMHDQHAAKLENIARSRSLTVPSLISPHRVLPDRRPDQCQRIFQKSCRFIGPKPGIGVEGKAQVPGIPKVACLLNIAVANGDQLGPPGSKLGLVFLKPSNLLGAEQSAEVAKKDDDLRLSGPEGRKHDWLAR